MDAQKQPPREHRASDALFRAVLYIAGFVLFLCAPVFLIGPEFSEGMEGGEGLILFSWFVSPWVQLFRFTLLNRLLPEKYWGKRVKNAAGIDWFISLFTGACLAIPLTNLAIRGGYTGSLIATKEWSTYLYGQLVWKGWEFGIPDYFAALVLAVIADIFVLWAFALFRKAAFKPSLRAALTMNAAIYGPVTVLYLIPFLRRIAGM